MGASNIIRSAAIQVGGFNGVERKAIYSFEEFTVKYDGIKGHGEMNPGYQLNIELLDDDDSY